MMFTIIAMIMTIIPWGLIPNSRFPKLVGLCVQCMGLGMMIGMIASGTYFEI